MLPALDHLASRDRWMSGLIFVASTLAALLSRILLVESSVTMCLANYAFILQFGKTTELSRREREELEKQKAHERYMKLQEQGKTEQARKDLERLALIRQQRADAAKKREEEKAAKEQRKSEARK
ncbi:hypothetical protein ZEAMMB73_Zm00001d012735 [Zea mays]|uniref:Casein kinase substrate phosphoprotein PP28 domain-containing protein n=1 Tax=Zea mays TaxID=4577 RepID=A0A1D6GBJ7_MAIZE|nr:hypothetical protein ZEAMMB73_Zm00001d012735 [Zea mays]